MGKIIVGKFFVWKNYYGEKILWIKILQGKILGGKIFMGENISGEKFQWGKILVGKNIKGLKLSSPKIGFFDF